MSPWQEASWVSGPPWQGLGCCFVENCPLPFEGQLAAYHLQWVFPKSQSPWVTPSSGFLWSIRRGPPNQRFLCAMHCAGGVTRIIYFHNNAWRQAVLLLPFSRWRHWAPVRLSQRLRFRRLESRSRCWSSSVSWKHWFTGCPLSVLGAPSRLYLLFWGWVVRGAFFSYLG